MGQGFISVVAMKEESFLIAIVCPSDSTTDSGPFQPSGDLSRVVTTALLVSLSLFIASASSTVTLCSLSHDRKKVPPPDGKQMDTGN